jgi:hypothetical protein
MLAQNFKSAEDLAITDLEHTALVRVLAMLERGELTHIPSRDYVESNIPNGFSMDVFCVKTGRGPGCRTVACILGWARETETDDIGRYFMFARVEGIFCHSESWSDRSVGPLADLFMIGGRANYRHGVTTEQAASALRNYLTIGEAHWDEVLGACPLA